MAIKCQHSDHPPDDEKVDIKKNAKGPPDEASGDPIEEDGNLHELTLLKHDWFEKDPTAPSAGHGTVTAHLYIKQIIEDKLDIQLSESELQVKFATSNKDFLKIYQGTSADTLFSWSLMLKGKVDVAKSKCKIRKAFLEVNLAKKCPGRWGALEMPAFQTAGKRAVTGKEAYRSILEGKQVQSPSIPNGTGSKMGSSGDVSNGQAASVSKHDSKTSMGGDHAQTRRRETCDTERSGESAKLEDDASATHNEDIPSPTKDQTPQEPKKSAEMSTDASQRSSTSVLAPPPPPEPPVASCSSVKPGVMGGSKTNGENHVPFDEGIRKAASREATEQVDTSTEEADPSSRVLGYTGLENLGNTCYMNSILQCLANTRPLRDFFLGGNYKADVNTDNPLGTGGKLAVVFATLMRHLWSGQERYVAPYKIKSILGEKVCQFKGYMQQDAQEFMSFFLDGLHEDLNRIVSKPYTKEVEGAGRPDEDVASEAWKLHKSRNDSIVVDLFQGQLKSKLTCPVCKKISIKFDPFMNLSVPLPKEQRLITVYVVFKDPSEVPLKVVVRISQIAPVEQLQTALHKKLRILPENMRIFEAYKGRMRTFERGSCLSSVSPSDVIVCSEVLSPDEAGEEVMEVPVIQRTLFPNSQPLECAFCQKPRTNQPLKRCTRCWGIGYCNQFCQSSHWNSHSKSCRKVSPQAIGVPFVLSLPASQATYGRLQELAEEYAKHSVDIQPRVDSNGPETQGESSAAGSSAVQRQDSCVSTRSSVSSDDSGQQDEVRFYFKPVTADGEGIRKGGARLADQGDAPLDLSGVRLAMDWRNHPREGHVIVENKRLAYREHPSCQTEQLSDAYSCTLQECLELFTEPETLSENDAWYCPECKAHRQATKQLSVWRLPEILIVHLKRFSFRNILFRDKITKLVEFPIRGLDMSPFTLGKGRSSGQDVYDLFAVTNHSGTVSFGHYTAYGRLGKSNCPDVNGLSKNIGLPWRYFDDRCVSDAADSRIVSKYAYVLFYRRRMERGTDGTEKRLGGDAYPERHAVPRAASVTSQETHSTPAEEKRASLEDVDENELD